MTDRPQRRLVLKAAAMPGRKVKISIEDNGPGLSEEIAKNLFKPFVSSKRSGMGVGLSICQVIVTAHGGRIWADSNPSGAAFHFSLPAAQRLSRGRSIRQGNFAPPAPLSVRHLRTGRV
jgi:two-component system sensor kinase FixL